MSSYAPPTENVAIFDSVNFTSGDETITQSQADKRYLRFPNAQGTENLQAINVNGIAQFNSNVVVGSTSTPNNTPTLTTNKTSLVIGTGGSGKMDIECPVSIGGFGSLTLTTAPINLNGGARINQTAAPTSPNQLWDTNFAKPITMTSATATDRTINTSYVNLLDATTGLTNGVIYGNGGNFLYDNNINGGNHTFATNDGAGVQTIPLNFTSNDLTIATTNPPTCAASSTIALTDDSAKLPSTAWVRDYVATIPPPIQKTYTQVFMGNFQSPSSVLQFSPPAGIIKCDVIIVGTGGLASTGLASGGGAQVVTILGVKIPPWYGNSPILSITIGTGATFISNPTKLGTYVGIGGTILGSALDGNNAVGSTAGGATSGTGDLNNNFGTFLINQGNAGGVGANVIGGGNTYGGIAGFPDINVVSPATGLNQYGQGQGSASGSPINYGGAIFTWYLS